MQPLKKFLKTLSHKQKHNLCYLALSCAVLLPWSQAGFAQDNETNSNVEINLGVIDRFAPPKQPAPLAEPGHAPVPEKKIPSYPDGSPKAEDFENYEDSLLELKKKYFPEEYQQAKTALKAEKAKQARLKARRSIPAPLIKALTTNRFRLPKQRTTGNN